nr:hypothetical protein HK105_006864 [Polyrhizophydium stewartii]
MSAFGAHQALAPAAGEPQVPGRTWAPQTLDPPFQAPEGATARHRGKVDFGLPPAPGLARPRQPLGGLLRTSSVRSGSPSRRRSMRTGDDDDDDGRGSAAAGRRVAYGDFTTIERVRVRNLRKLTGFWGVAVRVWDASQTWLLILLMGAVTGWLAGFIVVSEQWLSDIRDGRCSAGFYLNRHFCCWLTPQRDQCSDWVHWASSDDDWARWSLQYMIYVVTAVVFAVASAILVKTYAPYAAGSGIPEVKTILGGFVIRRFLGVWTLLIKCLGLVLAVASGMSLGKEGPLVHVACCVGNIFLSLFRKFKSNEAKKRELLSAACAAGVSVAFGAPIGGVLFSLEEVSYYFPYKTMWRSFFMAMVAAISLQLVNPFRTGKLVLFQVTYNRDWHGFELPFFILLGILGGLYGTLFIKLNVWYNSYRKTSWLKNWAIPEVATVALVTALVSFPFRFLRENTGELVANLFRECTEVDGDFHGLCNSTQMTGVITSLLVAAAVKIVLTIATFGIRVPAGILAMPDLWIFTSCKVASQTKATECVTPGTYAMVGAAASLAGVTRMSVSLTVIMFELTGALSYVLPIMITILVAKWIGDIHGKHGIYDRLIALNGYPFLNPNEEYTHSTSAANVMTRLEDIDWISATGHTVDSLDEMLRATSCKGFPIVHPKGFLTLGYIGRAELKFALDKARGEGSAGSMPAIFTSDPTLEDTFAGVDLRPWIDHTPVKIHPRFPVDMLVELFKKMGLRYVLITRNGQLLGIITKKDILKDRRIAG